MSRIVFVAYDCEQQHAGSVEANKKAFYMGVLDAFRRAGNDVLCLDCVWGAKKTMPQSVRDKIVRFAPDVCVIGNYGFWDLADVVDCPLWYMDIDSIDNVSMATVYRMRNNISRCSFIVSEPEDIEKLEAKFNAKQEQIALINLPYASVATESEKDIDVLYFGSNFCTEGYAFLNAFMQRPTTRLEYDEAMSVLAQYKDSPLSTSKELYDSNSFYACNRIEIDNNKTYNQIVGVNRIKLLAEISPLGLSVFGNGWNGGGVNYYPELLACVRNATEYSFDDLHGLYNRAKVAIIFDDGVFTGGSYLRIIDALSSDACVVAQRGGKHQWLFEQFGVPMFDSASDAIALFGDLLNNEQKARVFVNKAHDILLQDYNPDKVIAELQEHFGVIESSSNENEIEFVSECNLLDVVLHENLDNSPEKKAVQPVEREKKTFFDLVKAVLVRFGYDIDNSYEKQCYMIGPIIAYENMKIDERTNHIFVLSLPCITLKKKNGKTYVRPLLLEKIAKLFIKPIRKVCASIKKRKTQKDAIRNRQKALLAKMENYDVVKNKLERGEKIKVCLFVARISCWTFANLYKILQESGKFEPIVVVKPFMYQGHDAMVDYMNITYNELKAQGYNVIRGYDEEKDEFLDLRNAINPDIVFYTKYWKPQFQENFYIDKFADKITFYTSYCYDVAYHPEVMNFELNNAVDRYFMPTEIHKQMAVDFMDNHGENVHVVGAPKLDVFFDSEYKAIDKWKNVADGKTRKRIIWAPHHSDNFPKNLYQFNAFYELTDFMFDLAKKYEDEIQIAFKPHPMLKPYLYKKWGKESADSYYQKWADLKNGQLETGEFEDLFLTSDAMILDSISFIAEYTATNKPALFTLGSTSRINLNEFGDINYEYLYHTEKNLKDDIEEFVRRVVINGDDYKKESRTAFVQQYLMPPNHKTSAENIYDNIIDEIVNGKEKLKNKG